MEEKKENIYILRDYTQAGSSVLGNIKFTVVMIYIGYGVSCDDRAIFTLFLVAAQPLNLAK